MKQILSLLIALLITSASYSQDTIHTKKVMVVNVLLDKKTGRELKRWKHRVTVKGGYIIKQPNGLYSINGHEMTPDNITYSSQKLIVKNKQ